MVDKVAQFIRLKIDMLFGIDIRALAALRIGLGLLILSDLIHRSLNLTAFYTDNGILPRDAFFNAFYNPYRVSIHLLSGELWAQIILFLIAALFGLFLILGYRTRISTFVSWFLLISLHNRNEQILQGGDVLFHLVLFWAMFLPLGAAFSLDKVWNPKQFEGIGQKVISFASAALLLQVGIMYLFTALWKFGPEWRETYDAALYAVSLNYFATPLGNFLMNFPQLLKLSTIFVWWFELLAPILLFFPFFTSTIRKILVPFFVILHIGFGSGLYIYIFPWISVLVMAAFIPNSFWDWLSKKTLKPTKLKFFYDEDCSLCTTVMCSLKGSVELQSCQSDPEALANMLKYNSFTVVDEQGNKYIKYEAVLKILQNMAITKPISPVLQTKFAKRVGNRIYEWVAENRHKISDFVDFIKPKPNPIRFPAWISQALVAVLLIYIVIWNIGGLNKEYQMPKEVAAIGWRLNLNQQWSMFAPSPRKISGWFVIPGTLVDGTKVDVFKGEIGEVKWDRQSNIHPPNEYQNSDWRKYFIDSLMFSDSKVQEPFARYQCRKWNLLNGEINSDKRLKTFEIYFFRQETRPDGTYTEPEKILMWQHTCL